MREHEFSVPVVEGNESYYPVCCLTTFFGLFLPLRVFGHDDF